MSTLPPLLLPQKKQNKFFFEQEMHRDASFFERSKIQCQSWLYMLFYCDIWGWKKKDNSLSMIHLKPKNDCRWREFFFVLQSCSPTPLLILHANSSYLLNYIFELCNETVFYGFCSFNSSVFYSAYHNKKYLTRISWI